MPQSLNRKTANAQSHYPERIVQFGGGNFLRAFVDWIVEILNEETGFNSSVVIVKPTPHGSYDPIDAQDGLFYVQLHGIQAGELITERKLITCVRRTVNPYEVYHAYLELARQPEIRFIVSNTTEAGITFTADNRPDDAPPDSFPGKLTAFLYERYQHFQGDASKGCIILPCELIEQNGSRLQEIVLRYAELWRLEPSFAEWVNEHNHFCNTLVDRIVTGFPQERSQAIVDEIGFEDHLLVEGEQYHSWIIEAPATLQHEFPVHQTALNVKIVDDSALYREMKVRILNGAHTAMVPVGYLLGLATVREVIEHPTMGQWVHNLLFEEVIPSLDLPGLDVRQFAREVMDRFRNPFIQHRLVSIALNSTSKFKVRLLPSLIAYHSRFDELPPRVVMALAALIRFYKGEWAGEVIPLNDDAAVMDWFREVWNSGKSMPDIAAAVLRNDNLWGQDLSLIDGLVDRLSDDLFNIERDGILPMIEQGKI